MSEIKITTASVKVMRSFDYCHFEVCLSADGLTTVGVDDLRKCAARLADKAVEQYKVAKRNAELIVSDHDRRKRVLYAVKQIEAQPEADRSVEDAAFLKAHKDRQFHERRLYDYRDDWQEDDEMEDDE